MKGRGCVLLVVGGLMAFFAGFFIGKCGRERRSGTGTEIIERVVDTIPYFAPILESEKEVGTRRYALPSYRLIGGGCGGEPRQRSEKDICSVDSIMTIHYGTGAGGEPRCSEDSVIADLPIVQRHYSDSTYEAWVSGPLDPRLDSVRLYVPTTIITKREWKPPKRWHIGVAAGYGYGPKGFQPYFGVGLTFSVYSF